MGFGEGVGINYGKELREWWAMWTGLGVIYVFGVGVSKRVLFKRGFLNNWDSKCYPDTM